MILTKKRENEEKAINERMRVTREREREREREEREGRREKGEKIHTELSIHTEQADLNLFGQRVRLR